jgi:hypothetical protein
VRQSVSCRIQRSVLGVGLDGLFFVGWGMWESAEGGGGAGGATGTGGG